METANKEYQKLWLWLMNHLCGKVIDVTHRYTESNSTSKYLNYVDKDGTQWTITDNMIHLFNRNGANE